MRRSGAGARISWPEGPLRNRDFRLLFSGRFVSLVGDGAFLVAVAWEAYTLSNSPTALSLLGVAMAVPLIALLLLGGVVSDRHDRRHVMMVADLVRAGLLILLGVLALSGSLELWQMAVLAVPYGAAEAFFDPASDAILPQVVEGSELLRANALEQLARQPALNMAGPAIGGVLVGVLGTGAAFLADGATFLVSAATLWAMAPRPPLGAGGGRAAPLAGAGRELREGFAYVRRHVWLWGTFVCAAVAYLLFMGPATVLLPYMVKHVLGGSAFELGLVLAAGGFGAFVCAAAITRHPLTRAGIGFVYVVWTLSTLAVAVYGLATAVWQLMLACLAFNLLETGGWIVWMTLKQRHVPEGLLGRVSSLDWLISIGLLPLSLMLAGPLSELIGVRVTLVGAGVLGALVTLAGLALPGVRDVGETRAGPLRRDRVAA